MESRASGRLSSESRKWDFKSLLHKEKSPTLHLPQTAQRLNETLYLFAFGVFRKVSISAALRVFSTSSRRSQPFLATATPCLIW